MKRGLAFVLLLTLALAAHGESAAPPVALTDVFSFSLAPGFSITIWPDDRPGEREWIGPGVELAASCRYRPASLPVFFGADASYAYEGVGRFYGITVVQAGLSAGLQTDPRNPFGLRVFGLAGYSVASLQGPFNDISLYTLPWDFSAPKAGTPYVGGGAELSWSFSRNLSISAGVKIRYLLDLYADVLPVLRLSFDFPAASPRAAGPAPLRPAPMKRGASPKTSTVPPGIDARSLARSLAAGDPAVVSLSRGIRSAVEPFLNTDLDRNLQLAAAAYHALRILVAVSELEAGSAPDPIKPPWQALRDGSGSGGDVSLLYCSLLASMGVESAILTAAGRPLAAVALTGARPALSDRLLSRAGKAWVPVDLSAGESFLDAWRRGLAAWSTGGKTSCFHALGEAGHPGEPAARPGFEGEVRTPEAWQLVHRFRTDIALMLELEGWIGEGGSR